MGLSPTAGHFPHRATCQAQAPTVDLGSMKFARPARSSTRGQRLKTHTCFSSFNAASALICRNLNACIETPLGDFRFATWICFELLEIDPLSGRLRREDTTTSDGKAVFFVQEPKDVGADARPMVDVRPSGALQRRKAAHEGCKESRKSAAWSSHKGLEWGGPQGKVMEGPWAHGMG